jgi:hypothetical protein
MMDVRSSLRSLVLYLSVLRLIVWDVTDEEGM